MIKFVRLTVNTTISKGIIKGSVDKLWRVHHHDIYSTTIAWTFIARGTELFKFLPKLRFYDKSLHTIMLLFPYCLSTAAYMTILTRPVCG